MKRAKPHIDFWLWLLIALTAVCWCANTCRGAECCPTGQCVPTAPAFVPGPLGRTYRPRNVVPIVELPRVAAQQSSGCQASTVRVVCDNGTGLTTNGNGTVIAVRDHAGGRDGLIITCAHLLKEDLQPFILSNGSTRPAVILGVNPAYDLMALESPVDRPTRLMPLATVPAMQGQSVRWEGYATKGQQYNDGDGNIKFAYICMVGSGPVAGYRGGNVLLVHGRATNGQSGGPIYDANGLQAVLTSGEQSSGSMWQASGPWSGYIRKWLLECCGVTITGDTYTIQGSNNVQPDEPTVDPDDDTAPDIDIPVPDVDTAEPDEPEDHSELTLLIQELTVNVNQTTANVKTLTDDIRTLKQDVDQLKSDVDELKQALDPDNLKLLIADLVPVAPPTPLPPQAGLYAVLVVDKRAQSWDWIGDMAKKVQSQFSLRIVEAPADHSFGALPQLVFYRDGTPIERYSGATDVYGQLSLLRAGREPSPTNED